MNNKLNGNEQEVLQTVDHRLIINEAGGLLYAATEDTGGADVSRSEVDELGYRELLAIADFVNARREKIEAAAAALEATWLAVADEVINRLEEKAPELGTTATGQEIQHLLEELGPTSYHGFGPAKSPAGEWYQTLWTPDSYPVTFTQQWVSFLRVISERRRERFPGRYSPDGVLLAYENF